MAKVSSPIVPNDFPVDLGFVSVEAGSVKELQPIDATGSGIILSDSSIKFRLMRDDGPPVEYSVNVSVKRTPLDADETRRIALAKEVQQGRKAERDAKAAAEVQRIAERAKAEGLSEASKEAAGFKDGLKSAVTMLPALTELSRAVSHTTNGKTEPAN